MPQAESVPMAERLQDLPLKLDEWVGEDTESNERELKAAGAVGHVSRTYRNTRTGQHVSVFIVTGHSRDISVHTPDRCYPAAGFTQLGTSANAQSARRRGNGRILHDDVSQRESRRSPGVADLLELGTGRGMDGAQTSPAGVPEYSRALQDVPGVDGARRAANRRSRVRAMNSGG